MSLTPGSRLGAYEVVARIGAGGMGEVYRARDTKLNRDVALKVLPEALTLDPDRLTRFKREAQILASLNHTNIALIFELEEANSVQALVLELVDGPTLADRIAHGPIPIDEALPIASQTAKALEAAHEHGIIHRDLKPANIKVRPDGIVKVLDFGLAKALDQAPVGIDASRSPTVTSPAMTRMGVILGTAAYMAPEQAKGKLVDKSVHIWAFGCVLYEMLTGKRAFPGDDVSDVVASVLLREPDWTGLPATTPIAVQQLVRRCLEKDPNLRLRDVGDARLELDGPVSNSSAVPTEMTPVQTGVVAPRWALWAATFLLVGLVTAALTGWRRGTPVSPLGVSRFRIAVPSGFQMSAGQIPSLAISPDGSKVVFESNGRLYLRALDRFDADPIPGSDGAVLPFFSPDSLWLGFGLRGLMMKVAIAGGPPVKITDAAVGNGGATWGRDGRIVFARALGNGGLWAVPADGGMPEQITTVAESTNETQHMWPDVLPDGAVLYTVLGSSGHAQDARLVVEDFVRGNRNVVAEGVTYGRYLATGSLLYVDATGTLLLQPFDLRSRRTVGPARGVLAGVRVGAWGGAAAYAVSSTGTLAFVTGTELEERVLTEVDLSGRERRRFGKPGSYAYLALSPNGRMLSMSIRSANNDDIYLVDPASGRFDRFSFDVAEDESPVWSPDGRQIAYSAAATGEQRHIFVKTVGSAEKEQLVYTGKRHLHLTSWSPDGRWLAFYEYQPHSTDVWLLSLDDTSKLVPVANTSAAEANATFSPDGRSLAYNSNETGRSEVYVVSFPNLGGKQQISREGGALPRWSVTGRELFFLAPGRIMMARRAAGSGPTAWLNPVRLFDVPAGVQFVPAPDGLSFYITAPNPDGPAREIRLVLNWFQELALNANRH